MFEVQDLIEQCSGLFLDVTTTEQFAVQTDSVKMNFSFNSRLGTDVAVQKIQLDNFDSTFNQPLLKNKNLNFSKTIFVPASKAVTQPYWLEKKMEPGYFNISDQQKIGQAGVDAAYLAFILVQVEGQNFYFTKPVKYKLTDPVRGELYEPLVVLPPVLISPDEKIKISKGKNEFTGSLMLTGKKKGFKSFIDGVGKEEPDEVKVTYTPSSFVFEEKNRSIELQYAITATRDNEYHFAVDANNGRKDVYYLAMKEVKYDHIPYINYFNPANVKNQLLDLKIYGKKVGYIVGAGDKVPEALEQMGYEVILLTDKELSKNGLEKYDAIITGVRAYNTNEWMNKHYDKLMKYVNDGGNLIVQYNTSNQIGPVRAKIGPYNFDITRNRVTDENATVTLLKPEHPVFNFPNKITPDDFKNWIQERSIYHASDTSGKFEKLIGMNDPGEKSDNGSLIVTKYGKGWFTYTGIVFFRELPAGVPGAYRLLANIIALNRKKGF